VATTCKDALLCRTLQGRISQRRYGSGAATATATAAAAALGEEAVLERFHRPTTFEDGPPRLQDSLPLNSLEHDEARDDVAGDQVQNVPLLEVVGQRPGHRGVVAVLDLPPPEEEARRQGQAAAEQAAPVAPHLLGQLVVPMMAVVLRHVLSVGGERVSSSSCSCSYTGAR